VVAISAALAVLCAVTGQSSAAGPVATLTPGALDAGTVQIGSVSSDVPVTLTNSGSGPLSVSRFGIASSSTNPKDFWVAPGGTCAVAATLDAGSSCTILVRFTPSGVGPRLAKLSVWVNNLNVRLDTALTGTALPAPQPSLAPVGVDFGSVQVGSASSVVDVTLSNAVGGGTLSFWRFGIASSSANPGDFWVAPGGTCSTAVPLAPGDSCTVRVRFNPTDVGTRSGKLSFWVNTPGGRIDAPLTGAALPAPQPELSPAAVDFGNVDLGFVSDVVDVTLSNAGGGTLSFWRFGIASSSVNPNDFWVAPGGTCATAVPLAPGESCTVRVRFNPTDSGVRSAKLSFWVNTPGGRIDADLTGTVPDPCAGGCF
jgi:hypothetical protein